MITRGTGTYNDRQENNMQSRKRVIKIQTLFGLSLRVINFILIKIYQF